MIVSLHNFQREWCDVSSKLPHWPQDVSITRNISDSQCEPHRTGLLCSECERGYSQTLGNESCSVCPNTYLLLILSFALAGLLLVAILIALNLTVTEGSINGLIFYPNIMAMNQDMFYSGNESYLYTFLAWLNLNLGISTCLFDGMDGYAETWFQFVFPAYLWLIILLIFLFYNKFPALAYRLGGRNTEAFSGHRLFQWVNKLKPVFDAYAGPYKDKYRF